jgi:hypothetical protein
MAEYLKSQSPQELWKASIKPENPFKPADPAVALTDPAGGTTPVQGSKAPGTGLLIDTTA